MGGPPRSSSTTRKHDLYRFPDGEFVYDEKHDLYRFPDGEFAFSREYTNERRLREEGFIG